MRAVSRSYVGICESPRWCVEGLLECKGEGTCARVCGLKVGCKRLDTEE